MLSEFHDIPRYLGLVPQSGCSLQRREAYQYLGYAQSFEAAGTPLGRLRRRWRGGAAASRAGPARALPTLKFPVIWPAFFRVVIKNGCKGFEK